MIRVHFTRNVSGYNIIANGYCLGYIEKNNEKTFGIRDINHINYRLHPISNIKSVISEFVKFYK